MAWPLSASAQQQPSAQRRLGVLMGYFAKDPEGQSDAAAFVQGLGALNWKEGSTLRIDWRWGESDPALFERYAAELVALDPGVLLAGGSSTAVGALRRQFGSCRSRCFDLKVQSRIRRVAKQSNSLCRRHALAHQT
ncbi:MAG: hypothetical protein WBE82_01800 [Xanthobacteraceae bacterium]|jgi:putative ABC transport system substrate-binding protein